MYVALLEPYHQRNAYLSKAIGLCFTFIGVLHPFTAYVLPVSPMLTAQTAAKQTEYAACKASAAFFVHC